MTATATATKTISFTIDRVALRGLADLTVKDFARYNGMTCVRVWGKGENIYAVATDGVVAGLWHETNAESFHDFTIHLPVATVKAITKIGKKSESVRVDITGDVVRASSGGQDVVCSVPSSIIYNADFPLVVLRGFRFSAPLAETIPNIACAAFAKFSYLSNSWGHAAMSSQDNNPHLPVILHYLNRPGFVGLLMPLDAEFERDTFRAPEWLSDLLCDA